VRGCACFCVCACPTRGGGWVHAKSAHRAKSFSDLKERAASNPAKHRGSRGMAIIDGRMAVIDGGMAIIDIGAEPQGHMGGLGRMDCLSPPVQRPPGRKEPQRHTGWPWSHRVTDMDCLSPPVQRPPGCKEPQRHTGWPWSHPVTDMDCLSPPVQRPPGRKEPQRHKGWLSPP